MQFSTACPDWETRIVEGQSLIPFAPLFPDEAAAALDVFRDLRIVDAAGSPTFGEAARPWVLDFASAIFGAYDNESGRRLIREFLLLISKKNGKSTLAAGIMLTALIRNWRQSAEFMILAPTVEIAHNSFGPCADMIAASDELRELLHVQTHIRTITHRTTKATLKVVAAGEDTVGGKKAAGILIDELWLFGKRANAAAMLREATGGLASRPEGFVIYLSTQSDDQPAGVFADKLKHFRKVRDGEIQDQRSLGVLYEFPQSLLAAEAHHDPANFYITNPNLGASVDEQFLLDQMAKDRDAGEHQLRGFYAKHLNVEVSIGGGLDRWRGADYWRRRADPSLASLDALLERSEVAVVGIDGGGRDDLLGLCVMGRELETRKWLVWCRAWCVRGVLTLRKSIAPALLDFETEGTLRIIDDESGDDVIEVADIVERIGATGLLPDRHAIGVDPAGIVEIVDELRIRGFDAAEDGNGRVVGVRQGYSLTGVIKTCERQVATNGLMHEGSRLMNWVVGNAKVERRGNAVVVTKAVSGSAKIDPLMAMFNAASLMAMNPRVHSIYEERGLRVA